MVYTCGIFLIDRDNRVLVCHITGQPRHGNTWSIPKGLADEGETHLEAARRELMEETGIEISPESLAPIGTVRYHSASMSKKKTLVAYIAKLVKSGDDISCTCHSHFERDGNLIPEVDAFEWVQLDSAKLLLHESQVKLIEYVKEILSLNGKDKA